MMLMVDTSRVAKVVLYAAGGATGLFGLGTLVVLVLLRDCLRRNPMNIHHSA